MDLEFTGGAVRGGGLKSTKRHSGEWRFVFLRWSLASQQLTGGGWIHRALTGSPGRSAASLAAALAERLLFCGPAGILQQPVHHWHY